MKLTTWSLELSDPAAISSPSTPEPAGLRTSRTTVTGTSERLYAAVGAPYHWTDRAGWGPDRWAAWETQVETWLVTEDRAEAGYYELRPDGADCELAYFGLLKRFHGRGLGGWALTHALRRGLALAPRVWVHTCSLDGPAALPNYEARGLRRFREEETLR